MRGSAVHSLATGINTTSLTATRDWLLSNILQATDEYSYALSANMTSLLRKNFDINDRVNKAWFVNPGNRWNIPMTNGYQSDLLLSDKLLVVAMITLNDNAGNILRRRLLSFSSSSADLSSTKSLPLLHESTEPAERESSGARARSLLQAEEQPLEEYIHVPLKAPQSEPDDSDVKEALAKIMQEPRVGTLPSIEYNVDVASSVMKLYSADEEPSSVLEFIIYGKFDEKIGMTDALKRIGEEFYRRMNTHMSKYCPACERVVPVFNNLQTFGVLQEGEKAPARRLLQASSGGDVSGVVYGTYSVLLVYNKARMQPNTTITLADIQRVVLNPEPDFTVAWKGYTSNVEMQKFITDLRDNQFVIGDLQTLDPETKTAS